MYVQYMYVQYMYDTREMGVVNKWGQWVWLLGMVSVRVSGRWGRPVGVVSVCLVGVVSGCGQWVWLPVQTSYVQ